MGTFADYVGKLDIPEEKRSEYAQQMLTLLHAGGMLSVDGVGLFGRRIQLFYPPELGEDHCTRGWYNYFEDDCWGPWEFNADAGIFCPDKIGSGAFHTVVVAANILTALYSKNYNIVAVDGEYIREHNYIGWLNSVLGTQYTNWRTTQLWEIAKLLYKEGWCTGWHSDLTILLKDVPAACIDTAQLEFYLAACHLDKYIEIIAPMREGTATLRKRDSTSVSNLCAHLRQELSVFHANGGTLEGAKNLLTVSEENHSTAVREGVDRLPFLYSLVPPVLAAALTAKEFGVNFWTLWDGTEARSQDLNLFPIPQPCPPVEPISTQDLFGVSSDDMAYYWKPDGKVHFSAEMEAWIKALRAELDGIPDHIPPQNFMQVLVESISAAENYAFRDMFYEFIIRQAEPRVQAAVILLKRLAERGEPNIRRYIAILGNPVLRKKAFNF